MINKEDFANYSNYLPEDSYFEQKRNLESKGYKVIKVDSKWSGGSSPVILIKFKYWKS